MNCEYWDEMWNMLSNENGDLKCVCEWKGWLLGIVGLCDRESWAGWIATRIWGMARLSRADSLVGGHLYWEMWNDMRKEMKWYEKRNEMWENVRLSHPILIWNDCCDWNWLMTCVNDWVVNYFDWEILWLVLNSDWSWWYS